MMFRSLKARLALAAGLSITLLWLAAAGLTASHLGREFDQVYDDGLRATAERLLPIVRHDLLKGARSHDGDDKGDNEEVEDRENDHDPEPRIRYGENVSFIVRDRDGQVLLRSAGAKDADYPAFERVGFQQTSTHRLYFAATARERLTIAVSEPLSQRDALSRKMLLGLISPLLLVIPVSLLLILFMVRWSFRPVLALQHELQGKGARDMSPLQGGSVPQELQPISAGINQLLERLREAFQAERALAANVAHELRTPVAGAIAQAQRIRSETSEAQTAGRAAEIETTLKRLMRMSEKLMQLARAEGGRLKSDEVSDLRPVVRMIARDFESTGEDRIETELPDVPVLSDLDPDALGILLRNLIENALKHGAPDKPVRVSLAEDGVLTVANDGPPLSPEAMDRLMHRYERGNTRLGGTGLGLSIVKVICDRTGAALDVTSPRKGSDSGAEMHIALPTKP